MLAKYHRIIGIAVIVVVVAIVIISYFILPEVLIMQITIEGEGGTTMPKLAGLSVNLALGIGAGYFLFKSDENSVLRWFVISLIIIAVNIFAIFINL